jgi:hypothetical protein
LSQTKANKIKRRIAGKIAIEQRQQRSRGAEKWEKGVGKWLGLVNFAEDFIFNLLK